MTRRDIGRTHWIKANLERVRLVEARRRELEATELTVNMDKIINASIERLFDAWLKSKTLSRFMRGMLDARKG